MDKKDFNNILLSHYYKLCNENARSVAHDIVYKLGSIADYPVSTGGYYDICISVPESFAPPVERIFIKVADRLDPPPFLDGVLRVDERRPYKSKERGDNKLDAFVLGLHRILNEEGQIYTRIAHTDYDSEVEFIYTIIDGIFVIYYVLFE